MKRILLFTIIFSLTLVGCKKDAVDGSSTMAFQESINDMTSSLPTIQQIKFNEALYILKTFGVEAEGDVAELKALAKLLEGKKVPEIFALADEVAKKNSINWASNAPPSLGEMNIFQNISPSERDPNDIAANDLQVSIQETAVDSINGAQALLVVPRLLDASGKKVNFENAALEAVLEVFSQGEKILIARNFMQDNGFKGFYLRYASLPKDKIIDGLIDIKVKVKTSKKTLQLTKMGIPINANALASLDDFEAQEEIDSPLENAPETEAPKMIGDPKNTVVNFLNSLNSQNLKAAYSQSENPSWSSYEGFANPTSGFGAVKNIAVNQISTKTNAPGSATVNASYTVTDKSGNATMLDVSYGLKATDSGWKITSYKINSSQKKQ